MRTLYENIAEHKAGVGFGIRRVVYLLFEMFDTNILRR